MPTPSSNAPDPPHPPRSYPFSSCPDPDEQPPLHQAQPQSSTEPTTSASPTSTSSWHPRPPPPYSTDVGTQASPGIDDDTAPSRSITMSPGPRSDSNHGLDTEQEPEGMIIAQDDLGEGHKQDDGDEDMLGNISHPAHRAGAAIESDSERSGTAPKAGTAADGAFGWRKKDVAFASPSATGDPDDADMWDLMGNAPRWVEDSGLVGMGYEYSHMRVIPTTPSSYLRPGSRFTGTQQSERQRYEVQVEIKHVDMRESFLCGYLRIQGLTDDHPTLTTYFEGEIIGSKYGFITQHPSWGATDKIDLSHWAKFTAFRPFAKLARKGQVMIKDVAQHENIFMRWKEHFLVPDHRVRTINGASFEGFYYICFNQVRGEVSGIYFHSKSEKFQQLELKHVEDRGCFGAVEFR
ncbi:vacuolar import and degradation protein-domain-containing protein [Podospora appendiculata]|uniref:Vacuolar import and degradation protein-domain-containing protein n=1 Tax=Podospora appendiculata TaxID=314037 RepID=A0AAE0X9J0_9PEZI|nr:vacuolar import and degradation protein-domain-containing protein [Podospora appendiculata]